MLDPKTRRQMVRLLPFGAIWLISSMIFLLLDWSAAGGQFPENDTAILPDLGILIYAVSAMGLLGLVVGYIELTLFSRWFTHTTFLRKSIYKFLAYLVFVHLVVLVTYPLAAAMEMGTSPLDPAVWAKLGRYLTSVVHLNTVLQLAVVIALSIVYAQVSEVIGHTTLLNLLSGTYHHPIEEDRIYLFLDMRSSTTIAEQLGHRRYFDLLKAYYEDLSDAVVRHEGEVYLYVGDEMIVSWKLREGLEAQNCLRCFFSMETDLRARGDWYVKEFGVKPSFKAGLHCGTVTTGEVGVLKRHVMFTGDVLNATARIQALCNTFNVELLVSAPLLEALGPIPDFTTRSVGRQELRGRKEPLEVFAVAPLTH
ncbi:adenylate cyclase [Lewinella marina]|uniref:Adenylate/guanylate cyclase domain-containing protein n=1 Tax=Neolewinella marina TaxID=438751 RepID=A0A2G0CGK8_9BACT|nr:adenylate/guanylate cyclase domain-containing protein [Neolewinella marina]NJB86480.1 adenylate cyclase [Neolewinella marina]PHK99060.1 adenylate/guanylate cyclase domain-containing protein [Neolewinella marina]